MSTIWLLQALLLVAIVRMAAADQQEQTNVAEIWDEIFQQRNDDDWRKLWHDEKHQRCYQDLEAHMKWVCEKDIYKAETKRDDIAKRDGSDVKAPFLSKAKAFNLLGGHRRARRGIMDECCHGSEGCTWEEFAEYCSANARVRT